MYTPNIEIDGERVEIRQVATFPKTQSKNTIYLKLVTVQRVAADIYTQKENTMVEEDYARDKVVILGDEAHHYSASTKTEKETEQSWEKAIATILNLEMIISYSNLQLRLIWIIKMYTRNIKIKCCIVMH